MKKKKRIWPVSAPLMVDYITLRGSNKRFYVNSLQKKKVNIFRAIFNESLPLTDTETLPAAGNTAVVSSPKCYNHVVQIVIWRTRQPVAEWRKDEGVDCYNRQLATPNNACTTAVAACILAQKKGSCSHGLDFKTLVESEVQQNYT